MRINFNDKNHNKMRFCGKQTFVKTTVEKLSHVSEWDNHFLKHHTNKLLKSVQKTASIPEESKDAVKIVISPTETLIINNSRYAPKAPPAKHFLTIIETKRNEQITTQLEVDDINKTWVNTFIDTVTEKFDLGNYNSKLKRIAGLVREQEEPYRGTEDLPFQP